jgi:mevalonate kinase
MLKTFPAKVLLLGEYTILNGSKALALPYNTLEGKWSFDNSGTETRESSQLSLRGFLNSSHAQSIDAQKLSSDLNDGIWFDSTIPQGFGLGSSGAVIAAIFERYGTSCEILQKDKTELAKLENFFHGSSSGLDPLVSHIQKPLLIHNFNDIEVLSNTPDLTGFFLLNTGRPRQSGALISIYQEKLKDPEFKQGCADILSKEVNFAIDSLLKKDPVNLFHHLWHISKFQWEFFPEMIPTKERGLWSRGLESGDYILKLCGAGGGGFILGYSNKLNFQEIEHLLNDHELRELK